MQRNEKKSCLKKKENRNRERDRVRNNTQRKKMSVSSVFPRLSYVELEEFNLAYLRYKQINLFVLFLFFLENVRAESTNIRKNIRRRIKNSRSPS